MRRLVLLRRATELGHSIGQVARLHDEELRQIIGETKAESTSSDSIYNAVIEDYLAAIFRFDITGAQSILNRTAAIIPPMKLTLEVLVPLMRRVGESWHAGRLKIYHEHIISGQLRSLLGTLMRHVEPDVGAPRIIVATPPGHLHEFGAIIGAFMAASRGFEPIYLGPNMPFDSISDAADESGAKLILMSIARDNSDIERKTLERELTALAEKHEVWLGIPDRHALFRAGSPVALFHQYDELDRALLGYQNR